MLRRTILLLLCLSPLASAQELHDVVRVIDGDTLVVDVDGVPERVRLIGVDAPAIYPKSRVEPYGPQAAAFVAEQLAEQRVSLETDVQLRDRFGRLLAYVRLSDGRDLGLLLGQAGLARELSIEPDTTYQPLYAAAVAGAKSARKGLWSELPGRFYDRDCRDFRTQVEAQAFFLGSRPGDPHRLDPNRDGSACQSLPPWGRP